MKQLVELYTEHLVTTHQQAIPERMQEIIYIIMYDYV